MADSQDGEPKGRKVVARRLAIAFAVLLLIATPVIAQIWGANLWVLMVFEAAKAFVELVSETILEVTLTPIWVFTQINPCVFAPSGDCEAYVIHLIDGGQVEFSMPEDQGIRAVNVRIMEMLQLFYALAIIMIGIYLIFMSGSPQGRVNAKDMFVRVFVGMVLVSLSPAIFQFMLDIVREICDTLIQTALSRSSVTTVSTVVFTFTEAKYCCTMLFFLIVTAIAAPLAAYRYFLVYVMACIFPLILFMFFTDIPNPLFSMRGIGTRLWKFTILIFMVQILQTLFLCVGLMLANTAYAPTLLDFILMLAAYLGVLLAPMVGMQMMGWIGALVTVSGVRPVTQMTRFLGTWMRSGSVATAVTTSAQLFTIGRLVGDHVGGGPSAQGQVPDSPMDRLGEPGGPFMGGRSPFSGGRVGPRSMSSSGASGAHGASGSTAPAGMPINASTAPVIAGAGAAGAGTTLQRAASAPSPPSSPDAPSSSSQAAVLTGGGQSAARRATRASAARPPSMGQPQQPRPPSRRAPAEESPSMSEESQSPATVVSSTSSGTSGGGVSVMREDGAQSGSLGRQIPPSVNATTEAQTPGQAESPGPAHGSGVKIQTQGPMKPPAAPMPKVGAPVPSGGEPTARAPAPQGTAPNPPGADRQPVSEDELKAKRYAERIEAENRQEEAKMQAYNSLLATPKEDERLGATAEEARRFESKLSQMAHTGAVRDPDNVRRQVLGMADSAGGVNRLFQRDPASILERAEIAPAVTGQTSEEYIADKTMMPAVKLGAAATPVAGTPPKTTPFPSSIWASAAGTGPSAEADRKAILDSLSDKAAANNTLHELNTQIQNGNQGAKEFLKQNQGELLNHFAQEIKPLRVGATTLPPLPSETMKMRYLIELAANDPEFGKGATALMRDVMAGGDTINRAALTSNLAAAMRGEPLPSPDGKLKLPPPHSSKMGSPSEKFASVFVAQEVIAKTGLNPGRTAVTWWANNPYHLGSNIGVLNDLEQRQPGAAKLLNERYGITVFGRYGVDALLNQYNQHRLIESGQYKPKHSGIIVNAKADWNGALYNQADNIKLAQDHGFMFYEAGNTPELARAMLRHTRMVGAPQYRILGGHGTPDSIQLGDPYAYQQDPRFQGDLHNSPAYLKTSDLYSKKTKFGLFSGIKTEEIPNERALEIIRGTVPETGRVVTVLDSCSTGAFRQSDIGLQTKVRMEGTGPVPSGTVVKPYYPSQILERKKGSIGQKISTLSGGELHGPSAPTPVAKLTVTENPQGALDFKVKHVSGGLTDALTLEKIPPGVRLTSIYMDGQLVEAPAMPRHMVSPAAQPDGGQAPKHGVFRSVGTHLTSSVKGAAQFEAIDLAGDVLRGKPVEAGQVAANLGVSTAQMAGLGLAQKGVEAGVAKIAPKFSAKAGPLAGRALGAGFATYAGYQEGAQATGSYSDGAVGLAEALAKGTVVLPGLGTVAGGLGYVGGLAGQIADEEMKAVQVQAQSLSDDLQRNRFTGMELSLKGWVSGHGNTERYSSAELKGMFPSFADRDIENLRTHSELGFRNPNGWFRWKEDGSGTERMQSHFDVLNTSFTRANWGTGPYKTEADFLDHNNPNWRFLLSQESGQRQLFERNMPDIYKSSTVQDYVKRLDSGEVKARNLASIYSSNPELSKQIQPGEFWQKSGITPDVPASQMMQEPTGSSGPLGGQVADAGGARSGRRDRASLGVSTPMPGAYAADVPLTPEQTAYAESLKRNGVSLYDNNEAAAELEMVGRMTGMSPDQVMTDASVKTALDKMRRNRDTGIATNETLYNMSDRIITDKMRSEGASGQQVEGILRHVRQIRHDRAEEEHKAILSGLNAAEGSKEREAAVNYLIESTKRRGKDVTAEDLKSASFIDLSTNEAYMERMRASGIGDISPYAIVVDKADWKGKGDSPGLVDKFMESKGNWGGFNSPPKKGEVVGLNIISGEILEKGSQASIGSDTERTVVHEAAHEKFRVDATMSTLRKEALEAATRKELDERVKAAGITDEKEIERLRKHILKRREVEFRMINEMNSYFPAEASVEGGFRGSEEVRRHLRDTYIEAYGKDLTVEEKRRLKDSIYNAIDGLEKIRGKVDNETMSNILKTSYTIEGLSSLAKMDARMVDEYVGRAQTRDDAIELLKNGRAEDAAGRLQKYAKKGSTVEATPEGVAAELKRSTLREVKARLKGGDKEGAQELLDKLGARSVNDLETKTTLLGIDLSPPKSTATTADSTSGGPLPKTQTNWEPKPPERTSETQEPKQRERAPETPEPTPEEIKEAQKRKDNLDKLRQKAMDKLTADLAAWRLLTAMERQEAARKKAEEMQREEDALKKAVESERRTEEQDSSMYTRLEAVVARHQAMITEIQRRGGDTGGLEAGASRLTASLNQREYRKLAVEISEIGAKIRVAYFQALNKGE